jgi:hypothetical protein
MKKMDLAGGGTGAVRARSGPTEQNKVKKTVGGEERKTCNQSIEKACNQSTVAKLAHTHIHTRNNPAEHTWSR